MNPRYRNVICPWQTVVDIRLQTRTVNKMLRDLTVAEQDALLGLDQPDRVWFPKDGWKWSHDSGLTSEEGVVILPIAE